MSSCQGKSSVGGRFYLRYSVKRVVKAKGIIVHTELFAKYRLAVDVSVMR